MVFEVVPADGEPHLTTSERALVYRALEVLRVRGIQRVRRLAGGRSGALVVALDDTLVLKVTTAREQLARAAVELEVVANVEVQQRRLAPGFSAGESDDELVCLLTVCCDALPPAAGFDERRWSDVGRRMADIHRTPPPDGAGLRTKPRLTDEALSDAVEQWTRRGEGETAHRGVKVVADLQGRSAEQGLVLTHGDCHLDNLVLDSTGLLRLVDWQQAHLGNGIDDVLFLAQRAEFSGTSVPRQTLLAAYARARGWSHDDTFDRLCWVSELALLLVEWPPFLSFGTPERQAMMAGRLRWLTDALD